MNNQKSCNCSCDSFNRCLGSWYSCASWTNTKTILSELENLDITDLTEKLDAIIESQITILTTLKQLNENSTECCELTQKKLNTIISKLNETETISGWKAGVEYSTGNEVVYKGVEYKCILAHLSQNDWTPDLTPNLWGSEVIESNEITILDNHELVEIPTYKIKKNILGKEKLKKVKENKNV